MANKFDTVHVGHTYVGKEQVYAPTANDLEGLHGTAALGHEDEAWHALYVGAELS